MCARLPTPEFTTTLRWPRDQQRCVWKSNITLSAERSRLLITHKAEAAAGSSSVEKQEHTSSITSFYGPHGSMRRNIQNRGRFNRRRSTRESTPHRNDGLQERRRRDVDCRRQSNNNTIHTTANNKERDASRGSKTSASPISSRNIQ